MSIDDTTEQFIRTHLQANINDVALKLSKQKELDATFIINQINGRKKVKNKIPAWVNQNIIYPSITSWEQCSSEETAIFKTSLMNGKHLIDMTGGFGVDTAWLSKNFETVDYFELNTDLAKLVAYNHKQLNISNINVYNQDSVAFLQENDTQVDWILIDPARRDSQKKKVFLMEDCVPNIIEHAALLRSRAKNILVKLSPILDLTAITKQLSYIQHLYVVAVKNECKEILVHISDKSPTKAVVPITCVNIETLTQTFTGGLSVPPIVSISRPLQYLYEPNKVILKGGIQNQLANQYNLSKLDNNSHFFTGNELLQDFPGRIFLTKKMIKARKKDIGRVLKNGKANVIARNFPMNAEQIYQKFKIVSGGEVYLIATTLANGEKVIIVGERL